MEVLVVYNKWVSPIIINPTANPQTEPKKKKRPILRAYYRPFFLGAVPVSLLNVVLAFFFYPYLQPVVPLFNTMREMSERLADKKLIFLLPCLAVIINVCHAVIIYFGRKYDVTLLQIFGYFTIFIQVLLLAVLLRTMLVVMPI
jgi:hypothetical protein